MFTGIDSGVNLRRLALALALLALLVLPFAGVADAGKPAPAPTYQSVAYQINSQHSGYVPTDQLRIPPKKSWSVYLGGKVSYPLIAEGKVFVTVANSPVYTPTYSPNYGTKLYALDAATGKIVWGPIAIGGTYYWSNAAYEAGRVFVLNFDGLLRAFDAGSGDLLWQQDLPGQYAFSSPPAALNGVVYTAGAGSGATVYAVRASDGAVLWTQSVANGDHSSPAVTADGVYISYACPHVYKLAPQTGDVLWHYAPGCSGGGGRTPVYDGGRLYVRDWVSSPKGYVFDASSGALLDRFSAGPAPAFAEGMGYYLDAGTLQAKTVSDGSTRWSFAGDGQLTSAPIVVGRYVFAGSASGMFYALDKKSGREVWSTNVGSAIPAPDEHNVSQPLTGLAAGEKTLVVPAGTRVVGFR